MRLAVLFLLLLTTSVFANFIEITKSGIYDFQNQTITMPANSNSPAIVIGDSKNETPSFRVSKIVLRNLVIDGNKKEQDSEYHSALPFLRNNGITIRGASNIIIENVTVINARSGGLVLEKGCKNVIVRNSSFISSFFDGIAACETTNCKFENLILAYNEYAAISLDWWVENCEFIKIVSVFNRDWTLFSRASHHNVYKELYSIFNGGSYFLAENSDVPIKKHSSILLDKCFSLDFRGKFLGSNCFILYR